MAVSPVVIALNASGEKTAARIAVAFGFELHGREGRIEAKISFANALDHVRTLFAAGVPVIGVCASGILIRAVAPLLSDKKTEPPVISVSDDGSVVVPLLGGHRGANRLALEIAQVLDAKAAITTAGDVSMGIALDEPPLGWRLGNPENAKSTMAAMLAHGGALVTGDEAGKAAWLADVPLAEGAELICTVQDTVQQVSAPGETTLVYHPQRYVLGVGCSRNCPSEELANLVGTLLQKANISPKALAAIATVDVKADEPAILALAKSFDVPLRLFTAAELEAETPRCATTSEVVFAEIGSHGVAENAALACGGALVTLDQPKIKSAMATAALAVSGEVIATLHGRPRGRLSVVGIGPGQAAWRTPEVSKLVAEAEELVGYGLYIDLLGPLAVGKIRSDFPLGGEEDRCRYALEQAAKGKNVALVCSGDAGIYAMGALVFELLDRGPKDHGVSDAAHRVEVICSPGVSALQGAAARAGAPLGHDFCAISLSDLLTPRADIIRRLKAAAEGDFVIAFYNPVSKKRRTLLSEARDILLQHRPADTPVMLASNLGRPTEYVRYRRLEDLRVDEVDMLTVVLIGSSNSRLAQLGEGPRMYTPRGYARKIDGDLA
ncbi:cobalt-precorrin 5A hydrolase / precorrin-3B C17-methyltransferase [Celeribacter baekdonensis]|uniref:Cobalt-precorrin 5A hydrolase / precorrin-3B C17-methyltransferase n=1 Tax=Celeribacter baekdonensis TaxID=875171 RepID=A0A1G7N8U0_9RHOB|nr:precorrin-3B C(17)-methyltransferase [Celeribacter baekdonensis]SDF70463.1 cobalt-precorrin 5A hydrolase / precorrin-3B C17-methyltransferase [Celeribacter baekdonensis]